MSRARIFFTLATIGLLSLGGCVAYPVDGVYAAPAPVYVSLPAVYFGGGYGGGYRPYYGRGWRGGRGWR